MSIVTYNNRSIANISAIPGAAKSLTHIKTLTASSSDTLSFVDGSSDVVLDSTYPIYLFKFINIHPETNSKELRFNGSTDSGSNYNVTKTSTSFEVAHYEDDSLTNFRYRTDQDQAQSTAFHPLIADIGNLDDECAVGSMYLFNPSSTTFVKNFIIEFQNYVANNQSQQNFSGGYFNTTSAVDAIQFKMNTGNIDSGTIKLYGIKDS
jgi:hypothetical protein